jgi:hypothetical protein
VAELSVVIPTHNRPDVLPLALAKLRHQTLASSDYEIIVVDDGSSPPAALPEEPGPPRMILTRLEGVERSLARNTGAAEARGELLVFLDDDLEVEPDFLEAHLNAHREWPGAIATGRVVLPEIGTTTPFGRFRKALEDEPIPKKRGLVEVPNFCAAGNMSIARSTFVELGGFDPAMSSGEDQDLALRHSARGGRLAYLPEAAALHRDRALDLRGYCRRHEAGSAAMIPFLRRHPDRPENRVREQLWDPIRWGAEAPGASLRKLIKAALGTAPALAVLFRGVDILERRAPDSLLLDRLYRLLLGIHLRKGYLRGLRQYGPEAHERDQAPIVMAAETGA